MLHMRVIRNRNRTYINIAPYILSENMVGDLVRDNQVIVKGVVTILESPMVGIGSNSSTIRRYLFFIGERRIKFQCLNVQRLPTK